MTDEEQIVFMESILHDPINNFSMLEKLSFVKEQFIPSGEFSKRCIDRVIFDISRNSSKS